MSSLVARLAAALGAAVLATAAGADTFVYVHDYGELNQVHGFSLGRQGLEALPGSPFVGPDGPATVVDQQCNGYCQTMTWLREEKLLLTSGPGGLTPWRADDDGTLTPVPGAPFGPGPGLYFGVAAAAQGRDRFAWTADFGANALHGFRVEDDGTLTPLGGAPVATGAGPLGLQFRRGVLTVLHSLENAVASYAIERDGSLTAAPSSPHAFGASEAFTLDMDGAGRNVYVGDRALGQAFFFKIVNRGGELEARDANPVAMGLQNVGLGFALTKGRFVYALSTTGQAQAFRRRRGELHPLGDPVPLGLTAFAHALTPDRRAFAAASNTELRLFRVGAKGDLETTASAALTAENVNAVLFVRR